MRQLGYIPCASAGSLILSYDREGYVCDRKCSICEPGGPRSAVTANYDDALAAEAIATFTKLIDLRDFEESRKPRVQAMVALRHFAMHFRDSEFLDLETSKLGQWCLKSLSSSMRELRIAAGYELDPLSIIFLTSCYRRTLPLFLRRDIEAEILQKNNRNVLEFLRVLSDQCPAHITETCILAWGQVGRYALGAD
jgi:serine/threonine-protein kinase ATR